jgi:hypothetical protein
MGGALPVETEETGWVEPVAHRITFERLGQDAFAKSLSTARVDTMLEPTGVDTSRH